MVLVAAVPYASIASRVSVMSAADRQPALTSPARSALETPYYAVDQFQRSVAAAKSLGPVFPVVSVRAGIVPHDFTHGEYIAHFFQGLQADPPRRIILIGPNHFELGDKLVLTTDAPWWTDFGDVRSDSQAVRALVDGGYAHQDDQVLVNEHSVSAIMPFIGYYLPGATVVPVILKSELRIEDLRNLATALGPFIDEKTVIVAAVDFSHYLSSSQAAANDVTTQHALETLDYQTILSFGPRFNDYVDSPPSIALLLYVLSRDGVSHDVVLNHTNSGLLAGSETAPVTSFFEVAYY